MTKPTPKQLEAMNALAAGEVRIRSIGDAPARITGANPLVVGRVVSLRWASWPKVGEELCELTAAGHAILAEARQNGPTRGSENGGPDQ
jgi:hypothetical protein